ncbi:3-phenylpropionate/cinnamic acid dioxygenase small subunit [Leifsonia sp. AK011]|uniref:nuclear transport factor 2 family protein n=1 Tax=Leifsonia sp. AK011 TaxID=2723075 RepID=UPI0015CA4709|nr:nuclear transport factor 2 family protein [Leifsonia sp. AK011]NYF11540.1 3-phenylpropionate/cinnamic acid dioxygenase small subunit [Leifsonia sp. AK011]
MLTRSDRAEIEEVIAIYGHVVDDNAWDRAHLVFTDDFVFDFSEFGRPNLNGVIELQSALRNRKVYSHHSTNIFIQEVDEDTARVRSKFIGFSNEGPPISGDYRDVFVRTPAGWRLSRRRSSVRDPRFD